MRLSRSMYAVLGAVALGICGSLVSGCNRAPKASEPGKIIVTAKIAGADEAKKALETKDYEGLLKALGTASAAINSEAAQGEYRKLNYEVLDGLRLYRETDPKAEETFQAVRGMVMGR